MGLLTARQACPVTFKTFFVFLNQPFAPFTRLRWFCHTVRFLDRSVYLKRLRPLRSSLSMTPFFRFERKWLAGHRGERVGEASNPGPPKGFRGPKTTSSQTKQSDDSTKGGNLPGSTLGPESAAPTAPRWRDRPSEVECHECRTYLVESAGKVWDFETSKFKKQAKTNIVLCSVMGPSCECTMFAEDGKYTCKVCDHYVCIPCSRSGTAATQTRDAASSSAVFPAAGAAAVPVPPGTATAASTATPWTTTTAITDSRPRAFDENWELARLAASHAPHPLAMAPRIFFPPVAPSIQGPVGT